jgi:hypothetical protein
MELRKKVEEIVSLGHFILWDLAWSLAARFSFPGAVADAEFLLGLVVLASPAVPFSFQASPIESVSRKNTSLGLQGCIYGWQTSHEFTQYWLPQHLLLGGHHGIELPTNRPVLWLQK